MGQASSRAAGAGHSTAKPIGMLVAAVGVVYGDIGTSPLYTLKEVFTGHYGVPVNHDGVFGILALIFGRWSGSFRSNTCCSFCGQTTRAKAGSWR